MAADFTSNPSNANKKENISSHNQNNREGVKWVLFLQSKKNLHSALSQIFVDMMTNKKENLLFLV